MTIFCAQTGFYFYKIDKHPGCSPPQREEGDGENDAPQQWMSGLGGRPPE